MVELVVARIGRPHGLRGEVSVEVRTDDPASRFLVGAQLRTDPASAGPLTLASVRQQSGRTMLGFAGVPDRAAAEGLRGVLLVVDVADVTTGSAGTEGGPADDAGPDADEWYDHELVGLTVRTADGRDLGRVRSVEHRPVQDLLVVRPLRPGPDGGDVLVPFVRAIVPEVDIAAGLVVVDPPGGLFEPVPDEDG